VTDLNPRQYAALRLLVLRDGAHRWTLRAHGYPDQTLRALERRGYAECDADTRDWWTATPSGRGHVAYVEAFRRIRDAYDTDPRWNPGDLVMVGDVVMAGFHHDATVR
jgi:hypothetical protein